MLRSSKHRGRQAVVAALLLVGAIVAGIALIGGNAAGPVPAASAAGVVPSKLALNQYAIFDKPEAAADAIPSYSISPALATNAAISRRQETAAAGYGQWATLEGDEVCVVNRYTPPSSPNGAPDTSRSCNSAAYLASHDEILVQASLMGGSSETPPTPGLANVISGIVPNGIAAVSLTFTDGTTATVPVSENGFSVELGQSPKTLADVTWKNSVGKTAAEGQRRTK